MTDNSGTIGCKFRGSGQTCISANRIYVHSSVYAEFACRLAEKVAAFKIGDGLLSDTYVSPSPRLHVYTALIFCYPRTHGPLIHERAVSKVEKHVEDAISKGAQILVGGKRRDTPGSFYEPTVLSDVPAGSSTFFGQEETFGPVAALVKFETEKEVIELANDTDFGLAGYFYSRDIGRIWRVAEALEVGMVGINTGIVAGATLPFGGVKESGLGREGGHGINEYMEEKLLAFGGLDK